jgi:predicted nucleotide-binding protein
VIRIKITHTELPSVALADRAEVALRDYVAIPDPSLNYFIAGLGDDVTDRFITGPAGSRARVLTKADNVNSNRQEADRAKVMVVHGRDGDARQGLFAFLRAIGLRPIEWSQAVQAAGEGSPYIGDVLNVAFSMAQAVVVLMTPDDVVYLRPDLQKNSDEPYEKTPTLQPRPNVLFEAGMALGRDPIRTIIVTMGNLRPFSDTHGRHVIRMSNDAQKRRELLQRLRTAGCAVDDSGDDWLREGNLEVAVPKSEIAGSSDE